MLSVFAGRAPHYACCRPSPRLSVNIYNKPARKSRAQHGLEGPYRQQRVSARTSARIRTRKCTRAGTPRHIGATRKRIGPRFAKAQWHSEYICCTSTLPVNSCQRHGRKTLCTCPKLRPRSVHFYFLRVRAGTGAALSNKVLQRAIEQVGERTQTLRVGTGMPRSDTHSLTGLARNSNSRVRRHPFAT